MVDYPWHAKKDLRHMIMPTEKSQANLQICAVWTDPSLVSHPVASLIRVDSLTKSFGGLAPHGELRDVYSSWCASAQSQADPLLFSNTIVSLDEYNRVAVQLQSQPILPIRTRHGEPWIICSTWSESKYSIDPSLIKHPVVSLKASFELIRIRTVSLEPLNVSHCVVSLETSIKLDAHRVDMHRQALPIRHYSHTPWWA